MGEKEGQFVRWFSELTNKEESLLDVWIRAFKL
jgi:hypothetical protein